MSFITWISNSKIQPEHLTLMTKARSYAFGRRVYRFQVEQHGYWLKFHQANSQHVLEQAFLRELKFYQKFHQVEQSFLLPFQIVSQNCFADVFNIHHHGNGLIIPDTEDFFSQISTPYNIQMLRQKIIAALDTLDGLHELGWVHGDLKAEHFRYYENTCRLIDFEQCLRIGQLHQTLDATPHYMAPELFHKVGKSMQSDLYAFGIILYEWLTQSRLKATSYHDWAVLHCQQLQIQLPNELEAFLPLLQGLTQKHVKQRFNSTFAAKNALKAIDLS